MSPLVDHQVDRPAVQERQRSQPTGTNRTIGLATFFHAAGYGRAGKGSFLAQAAAPRPVHLLHDLRLIAGRSFRGTLSPRFDEHSR